MERQNKDRSSESQTKQKEKNPFLDKVFHLNDVKLVSKKFGKLFFNIKQFDYDSIADEFSTIGLQIPKCLSSTKIKDKIMYGASFYPNDQNEDPVLFHRFNVMFVVERSETNNFYFVCCIKDDLGKDLQHELKIHERNKRIKELFDSN